MSLEGYIEELNSVKGFRAAGLMNFTGEMLVSSIADASIDLNIVSATFNDIFRSAHEASGKVGMRATNEVVISTPDGIIIMLCTGVESAAHVHLICILDHEGNQALAKMTMEKMGPKIVEELA